VFDIEHPDKSPDGEGQEGAEQIRWLRSLGDREALFQFMDAERQTELGLQAAEALVELGDVRGLDHLIASLKTTDSSLRDEAAQILEELNHPRGLRALRNLSRGPGPGPASTLRLNLEAPREQLRRELDAHGTDELVALWHERQHSAMPDSAVDMLEEILRERLGTLPRDEDGTGDEIDQSVDPSVQALWREGDTNALMRIFEDAADVRLQLAAAEALADLGDEDALDVLIEALDDRDPQVTEMAAEMLDWLDLPRGNQALDDRGIEFEADARDIPGAPESEPAVPSQATRPQSSDPWGAKTEAVPATLLQQLAPSAPLSVKAAAQQQESAASSAGTLLVGGVGGLIGFIVFRFGLDMLGVLPIPSDLGGWLQPPALYYLGASFLAGAASGTAGSRVAQAIGRRLGWEPAEGDLLPIFGALIEGTTSAVVVSVFMHFGLGL